MVYTGIHIEWLNMVDNVQSSDHGGFTIRNGEDHRQTWGFEFEPINNGHQLSEFKARMTGLFIQPVCRGFYWKPTIMDWRALPLQVPPCLCRWNRYIWPWRGNLVLFYLGCLEMGYWTYASFSQSHFASFLWAFWDDTSFGYGTEHMVYQSAISTLRMKALGKGNVVPEFPAEQSR